jgi:hypothetical protein
MPIANRGLSAHTPKQGSDSDAGYLAHGSIKSCIGLNKLITPYKNDMRIFGADACSNRLVLCCLEALPENPREDFLDAEFLEIPTNSQGLTAFLRLKPDVVILEPTGMHYIKFWLHHLVENGIEVRLVHNARIPKHRVEILDIPDKDDEADAYSLAIYYFMHKDNDKRWVRMREPIIQQMRDIYFKLGHNARVSTAIINRLHQVLTHEFPEMATKSKDAPLFWGWVAGVRKSKRYGNMMSLSRGLGISEATRFDAATLYHYITETKRLELELEQLYLAEPGFDKYRPVFDDFGFGSKTAAMILSQIYPFEDFLGNNGQPIVKLSKGRYSKKRTKKYLSLRRFKKALGDAPVREWSGNSRKSKKGGSALCRIAIWQWIQTRIIPKSSNAALKNERGNRYREIYQQGKKKKQKDLQVRARIRHQAIEDLFYALVEALHS